MHKFTFTCETEPPSYSDIAPSKVEVTVETCHIDDIERKFCDFIRGCGFSYPTWEDRGYNVTEDEIDEMIKEAKREAKREENAKVPCGPDPVDLAY